MRIFHVIDSGGLYGAEVMLLNLVQEQLDIGLDPVIASIGDNALVAKALEREARKRRLPLEIFHMLPGPNLCGALKLLQRAKQSGTRIIHSHGYKGNILLGLIPSRIRSLPIVSTLHGWTSTGWVNKMVVYEALDRLSLCFVDAVVCVNAGMLAKPVLRRLRQKRLFVVDNGIPFDDSLESNPQLGLEEIGTDIELLSEGLFTIGSIGRLSKEKGYDFLVAAVSLVIKAGIDAQLVVIGEGQELQRLTRIARQWSVEDKVHLIGYRADARKYMPLFDVYAISSLTEGLPITLLEAMQARTPVVATNVGGIPNVLEGGRAGVLVNPGDARSLADGIIRVATDSGLKKIIVQNAYERLVRDYSSRKMAEGYLKIYRQLCPERSQS